MPLLSKPQCCHLLNEDLNCHMHLIDCQNHFYFLTHPSLYWQLKIEITHTDSLAARILGVDSILPNIHKRVGTQTWTHGPVSLDSIMCTGSFGSSSWVPWHGKFSSGSSQQYFQANTPGPSLSPKGEAQELRCSEGRCRYVQVGSHCHTCSQAFWVHQPMLLLPDCLSSPLACVPWVDISPGTVEGVAVWLGPANSPPDFL